MSIRYTDYKKTQAARAVRDVHRLSISDCRPGAYETFAKWRRAGLKTGLVMVLLGGPMPAAMFLATVHADEAAPVRIIQDPRYRLYSPRSRPSA